MQHMPYVRPFCVSTVHACMHGALMGAVVEEAGAVDDLFAAFKSGGSGDGRRKRQRGAGGDGGAAGASGAAGAAAGASAGRHPAGPISREEASAVGGGSAAPASAFAGGSPAGGAAAVAPAAGASAAGGAAAASSAPLIPARGGAASPPDGGASAASVATPVKGLPAAGTAAAAEGNGAAVAEAAAGAAGSPAAPSAEEVVVEKFDGLLNCVHECVRPASCERAAPVAREPARKFGYQLDPFQSEAIACLEQGESVLVSAHTSAGKTTVAEYAIAMGLKDQQRVIYTSPIKALSNQKFRDLSDVYGNEVGLMTGDVSLNPSASVMIMTTEILRSMLYKGSQVVREVKWVVFDEIHYMRDRDRGVVWEETIILLPEEARLVFLSATIPNAREFAEWICRIKRQACHVIYTDSRPVPLQHFVYPTGGSGVHLVMDKEKVFKEANFTRAMEEMSNVLEEDRIAGAKQQRGDASDLEKLIMMCFERRYTPAIVFSFSKREVESNARASRNLCLTTPEEQDLIQRIFDKAMDTLGEDKGIVSVTSVLPLLRNGIGMHHGGLLPVVKEITEILFQESLVKVLFSTETFAMGINMPAKTVIFTQLKKFDGQNFRLLSPGEYIQMSGRAGRRGLDERGICIVMLEEKFDKDTCKELFLGAPLRIESQFHLGYSMLLKLLRVEGVSPEYLMRRSFFQFQNDKQLQRIEEERKVLVEKVDKMQDIYSLAVGADGGGRRAAAAAGGATPSQLTEAVANYYRFKWEVEAFEGEFRRLIYTPETVANFISTGRIVRVAAADGADWGYGMIIGRLRSPAPLGRAGAAAGAAALLGDVGGYTFSVVLFCDRDSVLPNVHYYLQSCKPVAGAGTAEGVAGEAGGGAAGGAAGKGAGGGAGNCAGGVWQLVSVPLGQLTELTQIQVNREMSAETAVEMAAVGSIVSQACAHFKGAKPLIDPFEHMRISSSEARETFAKLQRAREALGAVQWATAEPLFAPLLRLYTERVELSKRIQALHQEIANRKNLAMREDLRIMRRVLRKLKYLGDNDVVTVKGAAACEISCVDELVLCELLFDNYFQSVDDATLAMALSTMVYDEKASARPPKTLAADSALQAVLQAATRVADASLEAKKTSMIKAEYLKQFKPDLCEVVEQWMNGATFAQLNISESMFEGSVVRAVRRLEELLRQLAVAARSIGDTALEQRFVAICRKMRRGLIFSSSLYL